MPIYGPPPYNRDLQKAEHQDCLDWLFKIELDRYARIRATYSDGLPVRPETAAVLIRSSDGVSDYFVSIL